MVMGGSSPPPGDDCIEFFWLANLVICVPPDSFHLFWALVIIGFAEFLYWKEVEGVGWTVPCLLHSDHFPVNIDFEGYKHLNTSIFNIFILTMQPTPDVLQTLLMAYRRC
jgi:hypothetical protein